MSSDFAYANDIRAAVMLRTPRTSRLLLLTFLVLLVCFLTWAHFAVLEEVKRGNGKVVPSRQIQVVQSLEGGIVGDILVQEGAVVQQGQSLMRIDDTKFASELGEIKARRAAMAARVARLDAEAKGRTEITFPDDAGQAAPAAVATETSVFKTRAQKLADDVDVLNQQITRLTQSSALLDRELALTRKLCEAMQGELSVSSQPGLGSEFAATLPLPALDPAQALEPLSGKVVAQCPAGSGLAELLQTWLPRWDLDYRRLDTDASLLGVELDVLVSDCPDCLVGLRQHLKDRPVLLVTAYGSFLEAELAQQLAPLRQLARPLSRATLHQALQQALRRPAIQPQRQLPGEAPEQFAARVLTRYEDRRA